MDRDSSALSTARFAGCLLVVPLALERRIGHTPLHTATRRPQHDGGTPWSEPAVLRVGSSMFLRPEVESKCQTQRQCGLACGSAQEGVHPSHNPTRQPPPPPTPPTSGMPAPQRAPCTAGCSSSGYGNTAAAWVLGGAGVRNAARPHAAQLPSRATTVVLRRYESPSIPTHSSDPSTPSTIPALPQQHRVRRAPLRPRPGA